MATSGILLRNARRAVGDRVDIRVRDGAIAEIGPELGAGGGDVSLLDADGALVVPGLIDGHLHLDKTLLGLPWKPHPAGPTLSPRPAPRPDRGGRGTHALRTTESRVHGRTGKPPAARSDIGPRRRSGPRLDGGIVIGLARSLRRTTRQDRRQWPLTHSHFRVVRSRAPTPAPRCRRDRLKH